MGEERKRIKRAAVSEETRRGTRRAAVNPNARTTDESAARKDKGHEKRTS